jgi:hypothetical protein
LVGKGEPRLSFAADIKLRGYFPAGRCSLAIDFL